MFALMRELVLSSQMLRAAAYGVHLDFGKGYVDSH